MPAAPVILFVWGMGVQGQFFMNQKMADHEILSFGKGCDLPTGFTKLEYYISWIIEETQCQHLQWADNFIDSWTRRDTSGGNVEVMIEIRK